MEIIVAQHSGFCFGVKRALDLTLEAAKNEPGPITTLGPLIHNAQVVARLYEAGIATAASPQEVASGTLILPSHGTPPQLYREAEQQGLRLLDATCPFVRKAQDCVRLLREQGYHVVIFGDRGHQETVALLAQADTGATVVEKPAEAAELPWADKIGVVVQTTQEIAQLQQLAALLSARCQELRLFNTICAATTKRQQSALQLARQVDLMVVVGGRDSANTARLAQICASTGVPTHHIETAAELHSGWLQGKARVGVAGGASTPQDLIEQVVARLGKLAACVSAP